MAVKEDFLAPQKGEEETFAIEALVFSVQVALQKAMNRKGIANKELAHRLGMTPARVSQIFSTNGPNLTLKTIAKIAHALGEDFEFVRKEDVQAPGARPSVPQQRAKEFMCLMLKGNPRLTPSAWHQRVANSSDHNKRELAA